MTTIAVVIPTIPGREDRLQTALESVMNQSRAADQIIVQKDTQGLGAATTRNRGLEKVNSDYIAWLDDDDALLPNHLERLGRCLDRMPDVGLAYPIPRIEGGRDPTATSLNGQWVLPWKIPFGPEQEAHLRVHGNFIPITHMVRADAVRRIGGFPQPGTVRWIEDWGYLVLLLDAGVKFHHLPVVTWRWIIHDQHTGGFAERAREHTLPVDQPNRRTP